MEVVATRVDTMERAGLHLKTERMEVYRHLAIAVVVAAAAAVPAVLKGARAARF